MKWTTTLILLAFLFFACQPEQTPDENTIVPKEGPIRLHPDNPHYFLYRGRTLALITSAEHYGAVLNLDFNYQKYLATLAADGMNYTRIFTGTYFEIPGESFGIQYNTLAPQPERIITPWQQVSEERTGSPKYDLTAWNPEYFDRLKEFMTVAQASGIIVEVTLFSSIYRDEHWDICPQNPENNINIDAAIDRRDAQTVNNGALYDFQAQFVRKMVEELNSFDNFFFEIQNEPWADNTVPVYNIANKEELKAGDWTNKADFASEAALAWQEKLAALISETESQLEKRHLIAQNYSNFRAPIPRVSDHISILNFHYAWPDAVRWNYHFDKVIGFDESGFAGSGDEVYRRQAWQFLLSGGGLFNNLDYSFFPGHEDGLGENQAPGGGSKDLRRQLKILSDYLHSFPLERLRPDYTCVDSAPGLITYALSDGQDHYALFVRAVGTAQSNLALKTGNGVFQVQILNTLTGNFAASQELEAGSDGLLRIPLSLPNGELALKISNAGNLR